MSDPDCQMVSLKINVLILCNYLIIHGICTYKGNIQKKVTSDCASSKMVSIWTFACVQSEELVPMHTSCVFFTIEKKADVFSLVKLLSLAN